MKKSQQEKYWETEKCVEPFLTDCMLGLLIFFYIHVFTVKLKYVDLIKFNKIVCLFHKTSVKIM